MCSIADFLTPAQALEGLHFVSRAVICAVGETGRFQYRLETPAGQTVFVSASYSSRDAAVAAVTELFGL